MEAEIIKQKKRYKIKIINKISFLKKNDEINKPL